MFYQKFLLQDKLTDLYGSLNVANNYPSKLTDTEDAIAHMNSVLNNTLDLRHQVKDANANKRSIGNILYEKSFLF